MKEKKFKHIYEKLPEELEKLLLDCGYEVGESEDDAGLVFGPPVENFSGIALESPSDLAEYFKNGGQSVLCPKALKDPLLLQLIGNSFSENGSVNIEGATGGQIQDSENIKMIDHMSVGHYSDIVAADAFELGFNFVRIRSYLTSALTYFSYLNKGDIAFFPVDIEYGSNDSHIMIQIHANVQNFVKEYLYEALNDSHPKKPFTSLLRTALWQTDFLSVTYLKSAGKVIFSACWPKKIPEEDWFTSLIVQDVERFEDRKAELLTRPRVKLVKTTIRMESDELPGKSVDLLGGSENNKKNLVKIKRVVEVIQKVKKTEGEDPAGMTQKDIDSLFESLDDDKLRDLSDDEKAYILNCVQNPKEVSKLEAGIDRVLDDFEGEKYVDLFSESIDELSSDEVNSYFSKGEKPEVVTEADWGIKKIKIVEGLKTNSEEIRRLGGGRIELNAEVLKLVSRELESMEDDCSPMVDDLSDKVTEQMISDKVEMSGGNIQALAVEHARAIQTLQNQLDSANERSTRMVKLIDIMKERIASMVAVESKMKEQDAELKLKEASPDDQITYLKLQLKGALSEVRNREGTIEKIRASTDKIVKMKELEIQKLSRAPKAFVPVDDVIGQVEGESIQIHSPDDEVPGPVIEVESERGNGTELEVENKNLKMQLEIMSNRLSRLNENMEARTKQAVQKSEADILKLRGDNQSAISTINKLREEKERINRILKKSQQSLGMMEENVRLLKVEISHKKDEEAKKVEVVSDSSDEKVIKELQIKERKFTELLKEAGLKIKSYEQKIKFMQAQVNASQRSSQGKKQGGGAGQFGSSTGGNDQKFQLKIRQLETLKGKAEEAHKKALADLNGVKKDNVLLKQELNATKLKLDEVEKKLGKLAS